MPSALSGGGSSNSAADVTGDDNWAVGNSFRFSGIDGTDASGRPEGGMLLQPNSFYRGGSHVQSTLSPVIVVAVSICSVISNLLTFVWNGCGEGASRRSQISPFTNIDMSLIPALSAASLENRRPESTSASLAGLRRPCLLLMMRRASRRHHLRRLRCTFIVVRRLAEEGLASDDWADVGSSSSCC